MKRRVCEDTTALNARKSYAREDERHLRRSTARNVVVVARENDASQALFGAILPFGSAPLLFLIQRLYK